MTVTATSSVRARRYASPISVANSAATRSATSTANRLKPMLLHAPVQRRARDAELGGRVRHVAAVAHERRRDRLLLELGERSGRAGRGAAALLGRRWLDRRARGR